MEKTDTHLGSAEKGAVSSGVAGLAEMPLRDFAREPLEYPGLESADVGRVRCESPELHSYPSSAPAQTLENDPTPHRDPEEVRLVSLAGVTPRRPL
jgi:hypothetical protein